MSPLFGKLQLPVAAQECLVDNVGVRPSLSATKKNFTYINIDVQSTKLFFTYVVYQLLFVSSVMGCKDSRNMNIIHQIKTKK